jgi:hypothetical protein
VTKGMPCFEVMLNKTIPYHWVVESKESSVKGAEKEVL